VFRKSIADIDGQFDLIMFHHSFEHMDSPGAILQHIASRLSPEGQVILGTPVASSYARCEYGVNRVNLDAPRHFYLHTFKSTELLAARAGLQVREIVHEGNEEQSWASEQFARDIPSNDQRSIASSAVRRFSHWKIILSCRARANQLNRNKEGDLVCFHLSRAR